MKRLPVYLLVLTGLAAGAAQAQQISYVLVPTISPGVTVTKVELVRTDLSLSSVQATYVADVAVKAAASNRVRSTSRREPAT